MPEVDHRHCKVCGKVVGPQDEFCSKACRTKRQTQASSRKNYMYFLYAIMVFLVLVLALSYVRV
jgi:predicted nucleic acid-binding Zn ribbon protein